MISRVRCANLGLRGVSLGGVYTSIFAAELGVLFDAGIPLRSAAATDFICLSHGHADHIGALPALLGIRGLVGKAKPPVVFMPAEIEDEVNEALAALSRIQRYDLCIDARPMRPGDRLPMRGDLEVLAFRTHHVVPSLGFSLVRKIRKLRPEFLGLPGHEIAARKGRGEDLFRIEERTEISYCTDTLIQALDNNPELYQSRVLVLESTFLDERKSLESARAGCHVHLDEIIERADRFKNEDLVLMHFSQLYSPSEVQTILQERCPPELVSRIRPFVPKDGHWSG